MRQKFSVRAAHPHSIARDVIVLNLRTFLVISIACSDVNVLAKPTEDGKVDEV